LEYSAGYVQPSVLRIEMINTRPGEKPLSMRRGEGGELKHIARSDYSSLITTFFFRVVSVTQWSRIHEERGLG